VDPSHTNAKTVIVLTSNFVSHGVNMENTSWPRCHFAVVIYVTVWKGQCAVGCYMGAD